MPEDEYAQLPEIQATIGWVWNCPGCRAQKSQTTAPAVGKHTCLKCGKRYRMSEVVAVSDIARVLFERQEQHLREMESTSGPANLAARSRFEEAHQIYSTFERAGFVPTTETRKEVEP